ncbi:FAD binding domain-containing protein [Rhodalgimonas zhirmunskyi]|uniref:Xanthine dehydrogenase family protein subunit M n=1 Tax=Rhodalgimonas zhirmunskyi TaxID=2964767 RepID=A0AAJ1U966_9RHOB|nr:xanthine dehydrogenase family protein subunit M [Rhodoalgimonas zhirmunskyi]MDQ2095905.1 xanthine dehydrogenase family protein subunit M [Rhodoalgimonas zhirmunskyi]
MIFSSPETIEEAAALLAADAEARPLAGGTDLLVRLRARQIAPSAIVDLKRIPELREITEESGGWRIGAAVPSAQMNEHAALKSAWPGVCEGADLIGSTQIQGRCTVAGNLCNAGPAADSVPCLVAAGAVARIAGPTGTRDLPVEDIPTGPGKTALKPGEFVASILLPAPAARQGSAYLRFTPRTEMDIAVAGVGIALSLDGAGKIETARIALGAVGPKVIVADEAAQTLIGTTGDDAALDALSQDASAAATPISDKRGTAEFRREVIGVLAKRAAKIALTRAKGDTA